jgi:hypothetical protein
MYDFNEQQGAGDNSKPDHKEGADKAQPGKPSCGGSSHSSSSHSSSGGWDDDCGCGSTPSTYSGDVVYSRLPEKTDSESETVFAEQAQDGDSSDAASDLSPAEREELFDGLVRSQQPDPDDSSSSSSSTPETVAQNPQNPMQWTLVDLNSSCDKPGCDPESCDSEDCDTTEEYDRSEYEYAGSDRDAALTFASNDAKEYAYSDLPPAPAPFVPGESQKLEGGAAKAKKAAKAKEPKKAAAKKAKTTKAGVKKTATKAAAKGKKGAKKTATKASSKKAAKKPAAKSKKSAADPTQPLPLNDPHFPREQAA